MTIKPTSASIPDDGSTIANFTVSGVVQTSTGTQTEDLTPVVTLTAYQDGSAQSLISCTYNSTADQQQCVADQSLDITTSTNYALVVTYGGYSGPQVSATLTVTQAPSD